MGAFKKLLELKVEEIYTCGTGGSLDKEEHSRTCPAVALLIEVGL